VIRVRVREKYGVEPWQRIERDSRCAHPRQELAECCIEIGVSEEFFAANFN
jgi:hypothetical protein